MVESGGGTWWLHFAQDSGEARDDGLLARVGRQGVRLDAGRPFFLDREGVPHDAGNRFFASGRMRNLAVVRELSGEDGVNEVLREDRDLTLVRAPSWSIDALETWISRRV
jgi:hypothetical protein